MKFVILNMKEHELLKNEEGIAFLEEETKEYDGNPDYMVINLSTASPTEEALINVIKKEEDELPKSYNRVEIMWVDSESATGWESMDVILDNYRNKDNLKVRSAGYLIKENEDFCTLAQSLDDKNNNIDNYITIPKCSILSRKILS